MNNLFTKNDFLNALRDIKNDFPDFIDKVYVSHEKISYEVVFCLQTTIPNFSIKIYSTIPNNQNKPREMGMDAIRVIPLLNNKPYYMIKKLSRVNRTSNWKQNIKKRISQVNSEINFLICPTCKHLLVKRKNKSGTYFIGCSNFPSCTYTNKI